MQLSDWSVSPNFIHWVEFYCVLKYDLEYGPELSVARCYNTKVVFKETASTNDEVLSLSVAPWEVTTATITAATASILQLLTSRILPLRRVRISMWTRLPLARQKKMIIKTYSYEYSRSSTPLTYIKLWSVCSDTYNECNRHITN